MTAATAPIVLARAQVYCLDPLRDSRHRDARSARDIADWLAWLELGNKAARTLDSYERYVAVLLRAYPDKAFGDFDDGDLAHVLKGFPPKSRHIVKAAWNNWFKWGYKTRRLTGNPVDLLPPIHYKPSRAYDLFVEAEVEAMCALSTPDGELMTLLHGAGLRRSEARMMTGKRIDFAREQVIVKEGAKGGKERLVPMIPRLSRAMADLFQLEGIGPDDHLWYTRPGGGRTRREQPISNSAFDGWWTRSLTRADVRHRRPHMTRHSFATRLYEREMRDKDVQLMLGHESSRTTVDTYQHGDIVRIGARLREAVGEGI